VYGEEMDQIILLEPEIWIVAVLRFGRSVMMCMWRLT